MCLCQTTTTTPPFYRHYTVQSALADDTPVKNWRIWHLVSNIFAILFIIVEVASKSIILLTDIRRNDCLDYALTCSRR